MVKWELVISKNEKTLHIEANILKREDAKEEEIEIAKQLEDVFRGVVKTPEIQKYVKKYTEI